MADSLIALVGADYVLVAADSSAVRSILKMKTNEDKIMVLDEHKLLAGAGPVGDRTQFTEYIQKNIKLYRFRNNLELGMHAAANFIRTELAYALRSDPYQVNLLLGGYDAIDGPQLYFIDYLASMNKMDFASHGHCAYFVLSTLDKYYRRGMNLEEGLDVINKCIQELRNRFIINSPDFIIKVVDKDGSRVVQLPGNSAEKGKDKIEFD